MKDISSPLTVALVVAFGVVMAPAAQASLIGTVPVSPGDSAVPGLVSSGTATGTLLGSQFVPYISSFGSPGGTSFPPYTAKGAELSTSIFRSRT